MFDRFTERARKVMSLARQASQRFNHDYIGTEHLLLGLMEEGSGVGAQVLRNLAVDTAKVRADVEKIVVRGKGPVEFGQLPFTPRSKRVLEYSLEEAQQLAHNYIGSEHLLLGLIREKDGIAAKVLLQQGVKLEVVREEIVELLGTEDAAAHRPTSSFTSPLSQTLQREAFWLAGQSTISIARMQAARLGHGFVGTEHLLLAAVVEPGPAADLMREAGATVEAVRAQMEKLRAPGTSTEAGKFTPSATRVMGLTAEEAHRLGHDSIRREHLLLGLLGVPEGLAMTVLTNLGVRIDDLRAKLLKSLGGT